jgi:PmbA protein
VIAPAEEAARLADAAAEILSAMRLTGEVFLEDDWVVSVAVSGGKVESLELKEERGAGIRIFDAGRVGFAYTSDLTPAGVRAAAAAAMALAEHTDPEPANVLPGAEAAGLPDPDTGEAGVARIEPYRKVALARAMEDAARGSDPRVTKVRTARYTDVVGRAEVRNTGGLARGASFARVFGSIEVVAEQEGDSQSGYASDFALRFGGLDPFKIGREAARRALAKLGARRPPTRRADVVLDPEVAGSLLEALSPALSADAVLKGKSILAGKSGQTVAAAGVHVVDDGRFPGGNRTFPFDGEGVPTRRTPLIEGGLLRGYLHSTYTAAKMGASPTGNAYRSSYMAPPRIAPTTLYLVPSARSRESLLAGVEDGFHISEVMGLHTVDTITGEFSLGASGHVLRKGVLGDPVTGIGIAGNLIGFLTGIEAVATDLRLLPSGTAGSTTLVRSVAVSGA